MFQRHSMGCSAHTTNSPASVPSFIREQVEVGRKDGYWIEAFPFRTSDKTGQNLIGYGLGSYGSPSNIEMFINPRNPKNKTPTWNRRPLASLEFPVAMAYADITGNGFNDVIITDRYGSSMNDIWPDGGRVSWLENTGDINASNWKRHTIGSSPGMHRIGVGHFTRKDRIQICAVPIVVKSSDFTTPAPVIIYTQPDHPKNSFDLWPAECVMTRTLVHELVVIPDPQGGLDRVLLAGRDGVDFIWFERGNWEIFNVGRGLSKDAHPNSPYWGAGSAAVGRVDDDYAGYVGSSEGLHGNTVSVYTKSRKSKHGIIDLEWKRHVLHDFGPLNDGFTGSIHQVVCADIDGDGTDELLVAMMGSEPPSFDKTGVWCFKPIDLEKGKFSMIKLSNESAGRIAVADYSSNGHLDFSTISYSVPGYFESPNCAINGYSAVGITAEKLQNEVCFRVPRPATTRFVSEVEFLDVAARKLTLVVLPPNTTYKVPAGSGVKVMFGVVSWDDNTTGRNEKRVLATKPFSRVEMTVHNDHVQSEDEGAIFVLFKKSSNAIQPPYENMKQVVARNIIPEPYPVQVRAMSFPWVKVEDAPWANGRFKGLEFYNLVGFHVRYADDSDDVIAHIQLWTAGVGVSAGFHNHVEKSFCEIHACIVNGTGHGGMRWAKVADDKFNPDKPNLDDTGLVVVPALHEHGPLWHTGLDGLPLLRKNDTVDYPWHAWLAGDKSPNGMQSYDVWVAFEFPSFDTFGDHPTSLLSGSFSIKSNAAGFIGLKDESATDGTPVLAGLAPQEWKIIRVDGTNLYQIKHVKTGSLLASRWPPVEGQSLMGTHSPANMSLTSSWSIDKHPSGEISLRLVATKGLALSYKKYGHLAVTPVILENHIDTVEAPKWQLVPVYD
ncbi:hypothetical protein QCA50_020683 [Cerrena zonata]|uniref:Aldos-2-ulose dehydratase/isomerase (AUDH) Cupin domain-containing protein n=1 Tax=Cerrena zonata TaxID=2478898 RepID=A0AAW0F9Z0_9APHY